MSQHSVVVARGFHCSGRSQGGGSLRKSRFDAIAELAQAFPLSVFPDAVGLRQEGREHLLPYANLAFNAFGPPNELRQEALERAAPHVAWVTEQCQRENLAPGGLGAQIHAATDTGEITKDEAPVLVHSLLTAGLDTTINGVGAAIYCLARFPEQWQRLRQDPLLARAAFEEAIRFESPVQTFFRTTTRAVRIGDVEIPEGEKVLMFLGAANRDPPLRPPGHFRHHTAHQRSCRFRIGGAYVRWPAPRAARGRGAFDRHGSVRRLHRYRGANQTGLQQHTARTGRTPDSNTLFSCLRS